MQEASRRVSTINTMNQDSLQSVQKMARTIAEAQGSLVSIQTRKHVMKALSSFTMGINASIEETLRPNFVAMNALTGSLKLNTAESLARSVTPLQETIAAMMLPSQALVSNTMAEMLSTQLKATLNLAGTMASFGKLASTAGSFADNAVVIRSSLSEVPGIPEAVEQLTASASRRMRGSTISWNQLELGAYLVIFMMIMIITVYTTGSPEANTFLTWTGFNNAAGAHIVAHAGKKGIRKLAIKKGDPRRR
ncbi:hypothetical protein [Arthrobacter alpinus]|uniref:hypothetical protein n=1 Tax=Arthrobacter alpinus TaxID=656366 RepID=UPI0012FEF194|nr:hypothetical protein [Arthrobacter alpinus]